jgi:hypothetical protein
VAKSFNHVLAAYPGTPHAAGPTNKPPNLSQADRAHLERWADDDRANEIWKTIDGAAKKRGRLLPDRFFIQEVLGARDIATSLFHRRNNRKRYLKFAVQMEEVARVLRRPFPNGLLLMPRAEELARRLDEAAQGYRAYVAVGPKRARGMTWTRQSEPMHVFMRWMSKELKGITGKWLDNEVAVLTEIAFNKREISTDRVVWARAPRKRRRRGQ